MTEYRNIGQDVQAEIVKTVRRGQEAVVDAIKTWTDTVRTMTPPLPEVKLPEVNLPFASRLPRPEELVGNAYDLAGKLLAGQRKFAEDVLHATAALLPGSGEDAAGNGHAPAGSGEHPSDTKPAGTEPSVSKPAVTKPSASKPSGKNSAAGKNGAAGKKDGPAAS
jgi:hypothetical protein